MVKDISEYMHCSNYNQSNSIQVSKEDNHFNFIVEESKTIKTTRKMKIQEE
jgi:hypothetical protein